LGGMVIDSIISRLASIEFKSSTISGFKVYRGGINI